MENSKRYWSCLNVWLNGAEAGFDFVQSSVRNLCMTPCQARTEINLLPDTFAARNMTWMWSLQLFTSIGEWFETRPLFEANRKKVWLIIQCSKRHFEAIPCLDEIDKVHAPLSCSLSLQAGFRKRKRLTNCKGASRTWSLTTFFSLFFNVQHKCEAIVG